MKILIALVATLLIAAPALAQIKPCEELKSEIDAKIKANGVEVYSLEIMVNADVKEGEGQVVGSCEASTKKIVYKRGVAAAPADMSGGGSPSQPK